MTLGIDLACRAAHVASLAAAGAAMTVACAGLLSIEELPLRGMGDGAALRAPADAPRAFDLKVVRDGTVRQAQTVWAVGDMRGVAFLDEPPGDRPAPMSPADLRRLFRVVKSD